jgi:hypothetical protein
MNAARMLACLVLALSAGNVAALYFHLQIDQVNPSSVSGTLHISNLEAEPVVLDFPTAGTFDLMVDGNLTTTNYPEVPTQLTIPATSTIAQNVTYVGSTAFSFGSHLAQARYVLPGNPPAGGTSIFYFGTPITGIENLEYQFSLDTVSENGVGGTLTMHNPHQQYWMMNFSMGATARLFVDGFPDLSFSPPIVVSLCINPGETHTEQLWHTPLQPYGPGWHSAQARLYLTGDPPVGLPAPFFIGTSANPEELVPGAPDLRITVFPNPFSSRARISLNSGQPFRIAIFDAKGRKVRETSCNGGFEWDGRDQAGKACPAGVYVVKAGQGNRTAARRFVKL